MIQSIWKFDVPIQDEFELEMPAGAKVLTVQMQHEVPVLWALLSPNDTPVPRRFRVFGTGQPLHDVDLVGMQYVGTFQQFGGSFIGHLFEEVL